MDLNLHIFHLPQLQGPVNKAITFFTETPVHVLPPPSSFVGSGVYGLYYVGGYELYSEIASLNRQGCTQPIYVGKTVPQGWRTARTTKAQNNRLYSRLREHTRNIHQVKNLNVGDFRCRFMILGEIESGLVGPVEAELIRRFKPLWNYAVDGFGNHDPGRGRSNQAKSEWDVLHPGRTWAERLSGESPRLEDVIAKLSVLIF
jgi:hypothetical protein